MDSQPSSPEDQPDSSPGYCPSPSPSSSSSSSSSPSPSPPPLDCAQTRGRAGSRRSPAPSGVLEERWHDMTENDVQPPPLKFRPRRPPGVMLDHSKQYKPIEVFKLFFTDDVIRTLCRNTNKFVAQRLAGSRKSLWVDVIEEEMHNLLSLIIYQGLVKPSGARDLWRRDRLHTFPFPPSVMPGMRYSILMSSLSMSDPEDVAQHAKRKGTPTYDALFCLEPLRAQILTACRAYYHPRQNLSVDERMVPTKAKIGIKQYMKNKPSKWGYKLFVLADSSNGYTCDFSIYEGKARTLSGHGLSFDAVVNLLHVPYLGTGYHVYVDNFYTSTKLFRHLHDINYGACGTIRDNRVGFPKTSANALPKNAQRGDMRWIREGPLLYVKWKDTREVTLCSTVHKAYDGHTMQRHLKNPQTNTWAAKDIPVPEPVKAYNKFMGGVDLSDALIKYYSVSLKTMRWYVKIFLHFVDIAVVNSFIIHKEMSLARKQKPLCQKRFREILCLELADVGGMKLPKQPAVPQVKMNVVAAAPAKTPKHQGCLPVPVCELSSDPSLKASVGRRKCVHCKMKTMFMCRTCNVALCIVVDRICFTEWHDQKDSQLKHKNTESEQNVKKKKKVS